MAWLKRTAHGETTWTNTSTNEEWSGYNTGGYKTWTSSKTGERVYEGRSGGQKTYTSSSRNSSRSSFGPWMDDDE